MRGDSASSNSKQSVSHESLGILGHHALHNLISRLHPWPIRIRRGYPFGSLEGVHGLCFQYPTFHEVPLRYAM